MQRAAHHHDPRVQLRVHAQPAGGRRPPQLARGLDGRADGGERREVGRVEGVEAVGVVLDRAVAAQQPGVEEERDLAQLELRKAYNEAGKDKKKSKYGNKVYLLPKELDEKVASLHLGQLGANLPKLSQEQADYIGVGVGGPYKPSTYRY